MLVRASRTPQARLILDANLIGRGLDSELQKRLGARQAISALWLKPTAHFIFVQWGNILRHLTSALGMILSFLSLGCLMLAGATLIRFVAHHSSRHIDDSLALGAGFFVTASLTALWLRTDLVPLNIAALSAAGACLLISLAGSIPLLRRYSAIHPQRPAVISGLIQQPAHGGKKMITILIGAVIVCFLFLILLVIFLFFQEVN